MKEDITQLLTTAVNNLIAQGTLPTGLTPNIQVERARDPEHGDFACNIAMTLAKAAKTSPRTLAEAIVGELPTHGMISSVSIAGPGFINFKLANDALTSIVPHILKSGAHYGISDLGQNQSIHIEFVSANPTGPLHVGHGRHAAYGASLANILAATGFKVHREYYVNDAGRQMRILALSVWIRYLQASGENVPLPPNAYQGDYILAIAEQLKATKGHAYTTNASDFCSQLPTDYDPDKDKETYIDAVINCAIRTITSTSFDEVQSFSLSAILSDIEQDLGEFGVTYNDWFRESQLFEDGLFDKGIQQLEDQGTVYEKEGARWFRATDFGDEKDRCLIRANGLPTYFASDVAYHLSKFKQYDLAIDVLGSDHHGYVPRINAFLKGLSQNPDRLTVKLVQFAILYRKGKQVSMSTRGGDFVTLRELREEVGNDCARFFYVMRKPDQHLDFDLDLAKSKSNDNPVYYIQYAHARICSLFKKAHDANLSTDEQDGCQHLTQLVSPHEKSLLSLLARYPETLKAASLQYAPHMIAHYCQSLATAFHAYYNAEQFMVDDTALRHARFALAAATKVVIHNALSLLGVSCPKAM